MFDIIGDVHGHADELAALLKLLGYEQHEGVYSHPENQALFVGDFIDRGPKIREVLRIVRSMIDAGTARAVMGNHEFNAIAFHSRDPAAPDRYLRERSQKNRHQHRETLAQVPADELAVWIGWFKTLPLTIELPGLRLVHACWDPHGIAVIHEKLAEHGGVTDNFMAESLNKQTDFYRAVDNVLKGPELRLPHGSYLDKDGHERRDIRTRWFQAPAGRSYSKYALPENPHAPDSPVPESSLLPVPVYDATQRPVFFGHYWLKDEKPQRLAPNVACVDYSVARHGQLCAYRWNGERELRDENFVAVSSSSGGRPG